MLDLNLFKTLRSYFLATIVLLIWLRWLWQRRDLYRFSWKFTGLWGLPIVGSALSFINYKTVFQVFGNLFGKCKSNTLAIWLGLQLSVLTCEPEFVEEVLTSNEMLNRAKAISIPTADIFEGGILAEPANTWQPLRKKMNACFQHRVLTSLFPIFNRASKWAVEEFQHLVGKGPRELEALLQELLLETTMETTMGISRISDSSAEKITNYHNSISYIINSLPYLVLLSNMNLYWLTRLISKYQVAKNYFRVIVNELLMKKINEQKQMMIQKVSIQTDSDDDGISIKKEQHIFVDLMLKFYAEKQIHWNDIISNANNMVVASFETTASATLSTLIMLAMHPEVQERLHEEIANVFAEDSFDVTYEHLRDLPYLDMVVNETLRLVPPIPIISRQCVANTKFKNGLELPKDVQVIISIYHLQRRADIWGPNASNFDPNNFLPERVGLRHAYAFIPFAKGMRNCIGWRYAIFSIKIFIAQMLRKYRFSTACKFEDLQFYSFGVMKHLRVPQLEIQSRNNDVQ